MHQGCQYACLNRTSHQRLWLMGAQLMDSNNDVTSMLATLSCRDALGARQILCRETSGLGCTKFEKSDLVSYRSKIVSKVLRCAV